MDDNMARQNPPRVFGVFYPTGYVVLAFATEADAKQAREALLTGGYEDDEVLEFRSDDVIADVEQTRDNMNLLGRIGIEWQAVEHYLELARQGAAFLVVYAPSDTDTTHVMNVARRFDLRLAAKYGRFTVERLV